MFVNFPGTIFRRYLIHSIPFFPLLDVKYSNEHTSFGEYDENCQDDRALMEEVDYDNPECHTLGLCMNNRYILRSKDIFDAKSKDIINKLNELKQIFPKQNKYYLLKWIKLETAAREVYWLPESFYNGALDALRRKIKFSFHCNESYSQWFSSKQNFALLERAIIHRHFNLIFTGMFRHCKAMLNMFAHDTTSVVFGEKSTFKAILCSWWCGP